MAHREPTNYPEKRPEAFAPEPECRDGKPTAVDKGVEEAVDGKTLPAAAANAVNLSKLKKVAAIEWQSNPGGRPTFTPAKVVRPAFVSLAQLEVTPRPPSTQSEISLNPAKFLNFEPKVVDGGLTRKEAIAAVVAYKETIRTNAKKWQIQRAPTTWNVNSKKGWKKSKSRPKRKDARSRSEVEVE